MGNENKPNPSYVTGRKWGVEKASHILPGKFSQDARGWMVGGRSRGEEVNVLEHLRIKLTKEMITSEVERRRPQVEALVCWHT